MGRFFTLVTFVLLTVILILATLPSFIDWQSYREPIERAASDAIGREVKIRGRVGFTVLPHPSIDLGEVTVANQEGGTADNFLTLELLSARLALTPLLRGAVQVETFELEGADLRLERKGGRVNWNLAGRSDGQEASGGSVESLLIRAIRDISIKDFSAKELKVSYRDVDSGQSWGWEIKHGTASLASMNGPFEGEGRIVVGDEAFYISGKLGLARPDRPRPVLLEATAANGLSLKFTGAADRSSSALTVDGKMHISAPAVHDFAIPFAALTGTGLEAWSGSARLDQPATLSGDVTLSGAGIEAPNVELTLGTQKADASISLKLASTITGAIDISSNALDLDALMAAFSRGEPKARTPGPKVDVKIDVNVKRATVRKTRLDDLNFAIHLTSSGPALGSFDVALPGKTRATYVLVDAPTNRGHLKLQTAEARKFLTWLGMDLEGSAKSAFRSLTAEGDILVGDADIKMTGMDAVLDGVRIRGAFVRTRQARPSFGANIEVLGLDLDRFGTGSNVEKWLDYMAAFDVNLILKLRQFSGFQLERRSVDLKTQVVNGVATVEDMKLYGAPDLRLRGKLSIGSDGKLAGKMRVDGKKLKLCAAMSERSALAVPGCASDPEFKTTGHFDVASGRIAGKVEGSAKGVTFAGRLGGVETLFAKKLKLDFRGKGEVADVTYALKGSATGAAGDASVKTNLEAEAKDLAALAGFFGGPEAWSKLVLDLVETKGGATVSADLDISPQTARFENLALIVGSAQLTGSGTLPKDGKGIALDLMGQDFTFLEAHTPGEWSKNKLGFKLPEAARGSVKLSFDNLVFGGIPLQTLKLSGKIKSGGLALHVSEAAAFDGKWSGDVSLHPGKSGLYLLAEGKAQNITLAKFVGVYLGARPLSGIGDLTFSISADGPSAQAMIASSAGLVELNARNGALKGFNLTGFSTGLDEAIGELGARLVVEGALGSGLTRYNTLTSQMTLADGKLRTASLEGDLQGGRFKGDGEINLVKFTVKGRTTFDLKGHEDLPAFYGKVSGPLKNPAATWDAEELVLKFTQEWLLANQAMEELAAPAPGGTAVQSEELETLSAPPPEGE